MIPLFFKPHYEVIARMIREEHAKGNRETQLAMETLTIKLAAYFAQDNANFKREEFLQASGLYENE